MKSNIEYKTWYQRVMEELIKRHDEQNANKEDNE